MDSSASLLSGLLFASIGTGYLLYGKKQQRQAAFYSGIALIGYPYFISQPWLLWAVGAALMAVPWLWKN
jgi:hypothetical protein